MSMRRGSRILYAAGAGRRAHHQDVTPPIEAIEQSADVVEIVAGIEPSMGLRNERLGDRAEPSEIRNQLDPHQVAGDIAHFTVVAGGVALIAMMRGPGKQINECIDNGRPIETVIWKARGPGQGVGFVSCAPSPDIVSSCDRRDDEALGVLRFCGV
jgi:hypothetical protein